MARKRRVRACLAACMVAVARRSRPIPQRGFIRSEVCAVPYVAQRSRGDPAVESANAMMSPDMENDVAITQGDGRASGANERLLVNLDELCGGSN